MENRALIALAVLAAGLGCGKTEAPSAVPAPVVRGLKVEEVRPSKVAEAVEVVGTVRSRTSTVLSAKAVGQVIAVRVREGDRVRAGQVLVEIDGRDAQAQASKAQAGSREAAEALVEVDGGIRAADQAVRGARANRDLAAATYRRFQTLAERNSVSRQEFDEVEARYKAAEAETARAEALRESLEARRQQVLAKMDQAKADVAGAQAAVSYFRVTAPFAGLVVAKPAEVGMLAAPGVPLVTVEDAGRYRLEAAVEESRLRGVRIGAPVRVVIDALGPDPVTGRVEEIAPSTDPVTRSYLVKVGLAARGGLRSGLFGRAWFPGDEREVLTVPKRAVVVRGQLRGVVVVDGARLAALRLVTVGREEGDRVEVLSGLGAGERIVVDGAERVADGSRVE